ncbi:MAG: hypothetical protein IT385_10745 [Deltaproteobacteria bacterium]|nr:hypothetical protein [Deltaproteobacteria bacterium]
MSGLVARDLGGRGADAPDHERGLALLVGGGVAPRARRRDGAGHGAPGALGCALAELVGRAAAAPEGQED